MTAQARESAHSPVGDHTAAEAARLAGLSPAQIRRFESAGLLKPARRRGRHRVYSTQQVVELRRIRRLNEDLGVNLAGIEVIVRLVDQLRRLQASVALPSISGRSVNTFAETLITGWRERYERE